MEIRTVSLKDYSSLRIGGEGSLVVVTSVEELKEAVLHARAKNLRVHLLGSGTNSYFGEDLSLFLFVKLELRGVAFAEHGNDILLTASASEVWDDVVRQSVEKGYWGIENLSLIPGTVGAAPVQNIGAYGVELTEVFRSLTALDMETLETKTFVRDGCQFGYRDSLFKHEKGKYVITEVSLILSKVPRPVLTYKPLDVLSLNQNLTPQDVRDVVMHTREMKLPDYQKHPNAGSFFKNPVVDSEVSERIRALFPLVPTIEVADGYKIPAAWLIEHVADMKGVRMGDMGTWPNQPLVLVNYDRATADDVDSIAEQIRSRIHEKTGIVLEQEVNRVG